MTHHGNLKPVNGLLSEPDGAMRAVRDPILTSLREWEDSMAFGWMAGMTAGLVCGLMLSGRNARPGTESSGEAD
jgi:hypothetical protein